MKKVQFSLVYMSVIILILFSCSKEPIDYSKDIDSLQEQIDALEKRQDSLANALAGTNELKSQVSNLQKRSDSLVQALGSTNASLSITIKRVDSIKTQLASIITQISGLTVQLSIVNVNITNITQQILVLNQQYVVLQIQLNLILQQLNAASSTLKDGLLAYYPFSGNAGDSSGNGNNGTAVNSVVWGADRNGKAGSALFLNGGFNGGRIITNSNFFKFQYSDDFSISFWAIDKNIGTSGGRLISTENPEGNFRIASSGNGINTFAVGSGPYIIDTVSVNTWTHFTLVYSNRVAKLYKNGVIKNTYNISSSEIINHGVFTIGAKAAPAYDTWNGALDELRIYNRVLSNKEINELYLK